MNGQKDVYFHLLHENGKEVKKTIHADQKAAEKKFALEERSRMDGKGGLVERIAFSKDRIDVFLKSIEMSKFN